MEPEACLQRLGRLIVTESQALEELCTLLDREHGYLQSNDVESLDGSTRERQRCMARIFRVDEERRSLCRQQGYPLDLQGWESLIRWCDPRGTFASEWARCSAAAQKCRTLNDRNGALVSARLMHVQARLGALIDSRREVVTYGPRGGYAQPSSGTVLATEA